MPPDRVYFFDTTLRDGEQSPGCSMTQHEKLQMAHSLADLGVDILEAGFAISSDGDFRLRGNHRPRSPRPGHRVPRARPSAETSSVLPRRSNAREKSRIHIFLASSDLHLEYKLKMTRNEALDQAAAVRRPRAHACRRG